MRDARAANMNRQALRRILVNPYSESARVIASGLFLENRTSNCEIDQKISDLILVEAAGVEPASEIVSSKETPCVVEFRWCSRYALRTDKMRAALA